MSKGKPLVVLAGWLGCQKRSLRRYERLFESHGYQVLSRIASPNMVVEACFQPLPPPPVQCPPRWPMEVMNVQRTSSMHDFAWDVLREIQYRNCEYFLFYGFSNGGCLVWEQVRRILNPAMEEKSLDEEQYEAVGHLRKQIAGVIFDSCPSRELGGVGHALALCTLSERIEVMMNHGIDIAFFPSHLSQAKQKLAEARSKCYYNGLLDDPSTIPQLYLYSEGDALIPSRNVDPLFEHRREKIGSDQVFRRRFGSSRHCAHFIDAKEEYVAAVESFLEVCNPKVLPISKL